MELVHLVETRNINVDLAKFIAFLRGIVNVDQNTSDLSRSNVFTGAVERPAITNDRSIFIFAEIEGELDSLRCCEERVKEVDSADAVDGFNDGFGDGFELVHGC